MNKFIAALFLAASFAFAGCGGQATNTANPAGSGNTGNTANPVNTANSINTANTEATNTPATIAGADKTAPGAEIAVTTREERLGVAECDEYIEKYEACLGKIPENIRKLFQSSFEQARKNWKAAAANPKTKEALAEGCQQALETAKRTLSPYNCQW